MAAKHYLYHKLILKENRPEFSGKVKTAIDTAKQRAPKEPDGHKRLLQVNCESERDFMRLALRYLDFFYLNKNINTLFHTPLLT